MTIRARRKNGIARLSVDGELTIYQAAKLRDRLLESLRNCVEIDVNLSRVSEIDTAGVQVLMLVKREALAAGKPMRLVAHSAATLEAFDLLNLGGYFGDPMVLGPRSD